MAGACVPCEVLGPFTEADTLDVMVDGIQLAASFGGGTPNVKATYADGTARTWGGDSILWDGCDYQIPMTGIVDPYGNETTITNTAEGLPESTTSPTGDMYIYDRGDANHPKTITNITQPDGTKVAKTLDTDGRTIETSLQDGTGTVSSADYTYDTNTRVSSTVSGSKRTVYEYPDDHTVYVKEIPSSAAWPNYTASDVKSETDYVYGEPDADGIATTTVTRKALTAGNQDQTTVYAYHYSGDLEGQISQVTDAEGHTTSYDYTAIPVTQQSGLIPATNYPQLTTITAPDNSTTEYLYHDYNGTGDKKWIPPVTAVVRKSATQTELSREEYDYYYDTTVTPPAPRWIRTVKDVRGKYTYYKRDMTQDSNGNYTGHPQSVLATMISDSQHTDAEWNAMTPVTSYEYYTASCTDGLPGQLWKETVPHIGYNGTENIDQYTDQVTQYKYGQSGKWRTSPTETIYYDASGVQQSSKTQYDGAGRVVKTTDANNKSIWYAYDAQGRPIITVYKFIDANQNGKPDYDINPTTGAITNSELVAYTQNFYNCCNLLWSQDENGHKTYYGYDDMKRVIGTWTDIQGDATSTNRLVKYEYDEFGNQSKVKTYSDANTERVTTYSYDQLNRVTKIEYPPDATHPNGIIGSEEFVYDDAGRLALKKDGNGKVTAYAYDTLGRLIGTDYEYTGAFAYTNPWPTNDFAANVTYEYEGASGLKTKMVDSSGESDYTYDDQGRLESYKPPVGLAAGYKVWYSYNNASQKTDLRIWDGTVENPETAQHTPYHVAYHYSANGWLQDVKYGGAAVASFTYDAIGNRLTQTNGNGTSTDYAYDTASGSDARYFLNSITHHYYETVSGQAVAKSTAIDYTSSPRDMAGNPKSMADWTGTWAYAYDANNRLVTAVPPKPIPDQPAGGTYDYDWVGNRIHPPANPNPMVYNKADQLLTWSGMHTYTYYGDGSLREEKSADGTTVMKSYTYTSDGLLASAVFDGKTLTDTWDADRNCVSFLVDSANRQLVYDTTAAMPAVIQETTSADGGRVCYVREPEGGLLASASAGVHTTYRYYHYDHLGSTRLLTGINGAVTDEYAYDAYGALLVHNGYNGSANQPYQFAGEAGYYTWCDYPSLSLLLVGVRLLDTGTGRFTQRDRYWTSGWSPYSDVGDNPATRLDPTGNFWCEWVRSGGAWTIKCHFGTMPKGKGGWTPRIPDKTPETIKKAIEVLDLSADTGGCMDAGRRCQKAKDKILGEGKNADPLVPIVVDECKKRGIRNCGENSDKFLFVCTDMLSNFTDVIKRWIDEWKWSWKVILDTATK